MNLPLASPVARTPVRSQQLVVPVAAIKRIHKALGRLCAIALQNTGQARRAADFLLAWHNAAENGAWDPVELWSVDEEIAQDMLLVLRLVLESHRYPKDLGFGPEIDRIWRAWRHPGRPAARQQEG